MENILLTDQITLEIHRVVDETLIKYGLLSTLVIIFSLFIVWILIKRNIDGEVEKGVNRHKADIENIYARQIQNYRLFTDKQHSAYSKLNELLLKSESAIAVRRLRQYPDFKLYSLNELEEYLESKNASEYDKKRLIDLFGKKSELQQQMQDYIRETEVFEARRLHAEANNHYWLNALYFSSPVSNIFIKCSKLLNKLLIIREIPSGGNMLNKEDVDQVRNLEDQINPLIPKIIKLMKKELSSGQVN